MHNNIESVEVADSEAIQSNEAVDTKPIEVIILSKSMIFI